MGKFNDYWTVGYIKDLYAVETYGKFRKRELIIRNVYRRRNKWHVTDLKFTATGEAIEELSLMQPGLEVIVYYRLKTRYYFKEGVQQFNNGRAVLFLELIAWKVISHTDRMKDMDDIIWKVKDFDDVKPAQEDIENKDSLSNIEKQKRMPETKAYAVENFSPLEDHSDPPEEEDDLPF